MLATGRAYDEVLAEAQKLGYAEADPTLDVSGMDAAHKAAILSAIAFSADLDFSKVEVSGVDNVELLDLRLAVRAEGRERARRGPGVQEVLPVRQPGRARRDAREARRGRARGLGDSALGSSSFTRLY